MCSLLTVVYTCVVACCRIVFLFKQKTAYEMRISDWSSDVCSSDLNQRLGVVGLVEITADRFLVRRLEPYDGGFDRGFGSGGVVRGRRLGGLVLATGGEREQPGGEQGTDHVRLSCFNPAAWGSGRADTR